jgi:hypothetical protein
MSTIFGKDWADLSIEHLKTFLDGSDDKDEPLVWEAKGTRFDKKELRRQVCAFANGHEVGYLIIGADKPKGATEWTVEGVPIEGEPRPAITDAIVDVDGGVRPRPDFDIVVIREAPKGYVVIVEIKPTSTPPCIANGTVYERLPGKTQVVKDPLILADLYSRGEAAKREAQARADRAAMTLLKDWIEGAAGEFRTNTFVPREPDDEVAEGNATDAQKAKEAKQRAQAEDARTVRFAIGVAATGNRPNISGRLFKHEFAQEVRGQLHQRSEYPLQFSAPPDRSIWSQDAISWRYQVGGNVSAVLLARAAWDGSVAAGERIVTDDVYVDYFASSRLAPAWRLAEGLVQRLCGFGDVYMTLVIGGWKFSRWSDDDNDIEPRYVVMQRGPMVPGVDDERVASLGREIKRALGQPEPEPDPPTEPESEPESPAEM